MNAVIAVVKMLAESIPVVWDRFTKTDDGFYVVYGWIYRTDGQRDFLMIEMWEDEPPEEVWYNTSSAKYSRQIMEVLSGSCDDHNDCRKIEELLGPPTVKEPPVPIPEDWKKVLYLSIYSDEENQGYLKPNGDIVFWWQSVIPQGWFVLSHKKEVKQIIKYL